MPNHWNFNTMLQIKSFLFYVFFFNRKSSLKFTVQKKKSLKTKVGVCFIKKVRSACGEAFFFFFAKKNCLYFENLIYKCFFFFFEK